MEASLPPFVLELNIKPPKRVVTTKDGYLKRKFREEKRLEDIHSVRFMLFLSTCKIIIANLLTPLLKY